METLDNQTIYRIAETGHRLTTLLAERSRIRVDYAGLRHSDILFLANESLAVWENVADLDQYGLATDAQRTWTKTDWERAIRNEIGQPDPTLDTLPEDELEIRRHGGYWLQPTTDGGYWLRQGYSQVGYYRRRGNAIRAALSGKTAKRAVPTR